MQLFLSTFLNKIDKKGRVSVPAPFRAALSGQEYAGIVAYGSFINRCIEACGVARIEKLSRRIEALDPFSEERDALATTILGGAVHLPFDTDGRVSLPAYLMELAGISEQAMFVGKGETFEIWEPKAFGEYAAKARVLARERHSALRAPQGGGGQ